MFFDLIKYIYMFSCYTLHFLLVRLLLENLELTLFVTYCGACIRVRNGVVDQLLTLLYLLKWKLLLLMRVGETIF